jgi:SAM-dependent methyltransferase
MAPDDAIERRRLSFGPAADLYDSVRPSYPVEAVRWMLGSTPRRVADLGAGTGIFSRVLASLGHEVVAVEPDAAMRRKLVARSPGVEALAGSAEAIPLDAESVDAVTAAQSHHWFDTDEAYAEIARVIRPGGVFAPIWNVRDESVEWVAELSRRVGLEDGTGTSRLRHRRIEFGPWFAPTEAAEFRHSVTLDAETLLALIQTRSHYLTADEVEQARIRAAIAELTSGLPQTFDLPYVTWALRALRL